ncbi:unnamed protein product [Larinioides sclopetarius]|uniref:Secreted protein n=1 Tax=Larinioides sclopetarius TaxID=280406 RepID=A0AAV2AFN0_9ARAC
MLKILLHSIVFRSEANMKNFAVSIVLCFLVIFVLAQAQPHYSRHYHWQGGQGENYHAGNQGAACPPANCPSFCGMKMDDNGCPECVCIEY